VVARVYADFQNCDKQGLIRLNTAGSQLDLEGEAVDLAEGMELVLYGEDLQAAGVVHVLEEGGWGVEIDWSQVTDFSWFEQ
jgi:L-alanine-DL-glutamate epimerase-like enolase superfamily enzyme